MTEPSDSAKVKARELYVAAAGGPPLKEYGYNSAEYWRVACERLVQQVSDAAKRNEAGNPDALAPFVLPGQTDPLVEALAASGYVVFANDFEKVRAELARRGLKIVEASHDG